MRRCVVALAAVSLLLAGRLVSFAAQGRDKGEAERPHGEERSGPIAKDGGVEITQLEELRERLAYAVPATAKTTTLRLQFQIFIKAKGKMDNAVILYRFLELKPVVDDTGKLLSRDVKIERDNPVWQSSSLPVKEEVAITGITEKDGKHGAEVSLTFDAPARQAKKIKAITGRVEVIEVSSRRIDVKDLPARSGKAVVDPDLKEIQIKPVLEKGKVYTTVSVQVTGKTSRLWRWDLRKGGAVWRRAPGMLAKGPIPGGFEDQKGFEEPLPRDVYLSLEVLVPRHRHVVAFDLRDIELP